jgi:hypothetical protein
LPADFETFGQAVATSMADLLGGTTGQVLAKASNTDMDFSWVAQDDSNAIQNAIVDAKGDLIAASAADTPARLAVGTNGQVLTADSTAATGLAWAAPSSGAESLGFTAGKNKIINGDFRFNQRSFSSITASDYTFDRWRVGIAGDGTTTATAQTFTLGAAPVAGYEGINFIQIATTGQTTSGVSSNIQQRLESVRTFAGETVTISFWAKAASGTPKIAVDCVQNFGGTGSPSAQVETYVGQVTLSTSWARYSLTIAVPSISGKTITTSDFLQFSFWTSAGSTFNARTGSLGIQTATIGIWGVQVEAGSVATAFQTATGTIQGELAACQRYYFLEGFGKTAVGRIIGTGGYFAANDVNLVLFFPVTMRTTPTLVVATGTNYYSFTSAGGGTDFINSLTIINSSPTAALLYNTSEAAGTAGQSAFALVQSTSGSIAFNAEL